MKHLSFWNIGQTKQGICNEPNSAVVSTNFKMTRVIVAGYSTILPDLISIMEKPVSRTSFKVD